MNTDVGSLAIGSIAARIVLVGLVIKALVDGRRQLAIIAIILAAIGFFGVPRLNPGLVTPYLAILDIGLVFAVLGRDIRFT